MKNLSNYWNENVTVKKKKNAPLHDFLRVHFVVHLGGRVKKLKTGFQTGLDLPALLHSPHQDVQSEYNDARSHTEHPGHTVGPGGVKRILATVLVQGVVDVYVAAFRGFGAVSLLREYKYNIWNKIIFQRYLSVWKSSIIYSFKNHSLQHKN